MLRKHKPIAGRGLALPLGREERRRLYFALAREHESIMVRVALRLAENQTLAEDVVRDAVLAALPAFEEGRLAHPSEFRPWILAFVWNAYRTQRRREHRHGTVEDAVLERTMDPAPGPAEQLARVTMSEPVEQALAALSADQRLCVELVYVQEMEYAEAAAVLGVPVGTVRSRLARARGTMLAMLRENGGNE